MSIQMWFNVAIVVLLLINMAILAISSGTYFNDADLKYAAMASEVKKIQDGLRSMLVIISRGMVPLPPAKSPGPAAPLPAEEATAPPQAETTDPSEIDVSSIRPRLKL